jgi:nicotinamide-nucleotide amidase
VTTVLSSPGDLYVHLRATGETVEQADALLREVGNPISALLGDKIYTENVDEPLEGVIGRLLRKHHGTVAVAESCTGGMLSARLTEQAGSSDYFIAGYVTYSEAQKSEVLGIPRDLISKHSAVSEPVAAAMAEGAKRKSGSTHAISVTGYAGPAGGTDFDPVGTVYFGITGPDGTRVVRTRFGAGDRLRTRLLATQSALDLLRKTLLVRENQLRSAV